MAVSSVSGTQAATVGTEHTLADTSGSGTYQLAVDTTNMAAGDVLELRLKKILLSGDTPPGPVALYQAYYDAQPTDDLVKISVPISTAYGAAGAIRATLKQVAGTGRNFKWELLKFA